MSTGGQIRTDTVLVLSETPPSVGLRRRESSRVDSNHRSSACKAVALAAEPRDVRAETEGIEPPTLAGSRFQDGFLDQPDNLLIVCFACVRNSGGPSRTDSPIVQSEAC